jgi:hypothetical protein
MRSAQSSNEDSGRVDHPGRCGAQLTTEEPERQKQYDRQQHTR